MDACDPSPPSEFDRWLPRVWLSGLLADCSLADLFRRVPPPSPPKAGGLRLGCALRVTPYYRVIPLPPSSLLCASPCCVKTGASGVGPAPSRVDCLGP